MKQSNSQKFNLGLFVILSTIILIIALYFVGNRQNLFGKTFKISAVFNNVNGLQPGNNVRYSGINVGTVKNILMINDTTIVVNMVIEDKFLIHLKRNAVAAIGSDGLVGSMVINIAPHKNISSPLKPGDTIKSYSKISTSDMLETLNTTNDNAALLISDFLKITTSINQGKGTLGMLITDPETALNVKQAVVNLKGASADAAKTISDVKNIVSSINYDESFAAVLLSDSISAIKLKEIISNIHKSSNGIDSVLINLNDILLSAQTGDGIINYALNDTILVKNIDETVKNINIGSTKLNENLEALKHNFFFRRYFKKLERQKQKELKKQN